MNKHSIETMVCASHAGDDGQKELYIFHVICVNSKDFAACSLLRTQNFGILMFLEMCARSSLSLSLSRSNLCLYYSYSMHSCDAYLKIKFKTVQELGFNSNTEMLKVFNDFRDWEIQRERVLAHWEHCVERSITSPISTGIFLSLKVISTHVCKKIVQNSFRPNGKQSKITTIVHEITN